MKIEKAEALQPGAIVAISVAFWTKMVKRKQQRRRHTTLAELVSIQRTGKTSGFAMVKGHTDGPYKASTRNMRLATEAEAQSFSEEAEMTRVHLAEMARFRHVLRLPDESFPPFGDVVLFLTAPEARALVERLEKLEGVVGQVAGVIE